MAVEQQEPAAAAAQHQPKVGALKISSIARDPAKTFPANNDNSSASGGENAANLADVTNIADAANVIDAAAANLATSAAATDFVDLGGDISAELGSPQIVGVHSGVSCANLLFFLINAESMYCF